MMLLSAFARWTPLWASTSRVSHGQCLHQTASTAVLLAPSDSMNLAPGLFPLHLGNPSMHAGIRSLFAKRSFYPGDVMFSIPGQLCMLLAAFRAHASCSPGALA